MPEDIDNHRPDAARGHEVFPEPTVAAYGRHVANEGRRRTFDELAASNNESYYFAVQEVIEQLLTLPHDELPLRYDELTFTIRIGQRALEYDSGFAVDPEHLVALGRLGFWINVVLNPEQP